MMKIRNIYIKVFTKKLLPIIFIFCLIGALVFSLFATYDTYSSIIIEQQQKQLYTISTAVSKSLELYISEQLRDVSIITATPGFINEFEKYYSEDNGDGIKEYLLTYMISQEKGLSRAYLLDKDAKEIFKYDTYPFIEDFDEEVLNLKKLVADGKTGIGNIFEISKGHWGVTLVNSVYAGDTFCGSIIGIVDLKDLFTQFVLPLKFGETGLLSVMSDDGTIIMHPDQNFLGKNSWDMANYYSSNKKFETFITVYDDMKNKENGTNIYLTPFSYEEPIKDSFEIIGFTRMNLGDTKWIVSATLPYDDAIKPVNEILSRFLILISVVALIISVSSTIIIRLRRNEQKLMVETRHLKDLNHTLEELNEMEKQVRHFQKLQTVGTFAGGIAHEFNNLLTPIIGYSNYLLDLDTLDEDVLEDINEIYKAGMDAKEIVEQILPFSRKEDQKSSFEIVEMESTVLDAIKMVRMLIPSSVNLVESLNFSGANVYGNLTQIKQVIINLCSNAYKAMDNGEGTIRIKTETIGASKILVASALKPAIGKYFSITISDNGKGINEEVLNRIFDPFFTTNETGKGTGLGLSIVQNIIENHRGFIDVKSNEGIGSSFSVFLPVSDKPFEEKVETKFKKSDASSSVTIMIVDDEVRVTKFLDKLLRKKGFDVLVFNNALEALESFKQNKVDLIIVDYTMPNMKGTSFSRSVKELYSKVPIILTSGLVEKEVVELSQRKIIDRIMLKPFDQNELLECIFELLKTEKNI